MRTVGLLVLGLGVGLGAGYLAGDRWGSPALVWLALVLVVLSSVPIAVDSRGATGPPADPELPGLGRRVEQILELAEEQAAYKIRSAEEEAERIVADARMRAGQVTDGD